MPYEHILYDVSDSIATVTLNRPEKLNAWTPTMAKEMREAMFAAEKDDEVRVIILTGAGRGFCAGADMGGLSDTAKQGATGSLNRPATEENGARREGIRPDFLKNYSYMPSVQKPIIGAINGASAGLGFVIPLYCDMRFASDKAKFTTSFARRGLIAEHGLSWMLPRLIGIGNAMDLTLSGRLILADEALRMGLVQRVFPNETFMEAVRSYATELATLVSPRSLRIMKEQIYNAQFQNLAEAITIADEEMAKSLLTADFREGVAHFVEKRAPVFTGQ